MAVELENVVTVLAYSGWYRLIWAQIDWEICRACEPCQARQACTLRAIVKFAADELFFIDPHRCRGCGKCMPACPYSAIHLNKPDRQEKPERSA